MKIPRRSERLKQTEERLKKIWIKTAAIEAASKGLSFETTDKTSAELDFLVKQMMVAFDETGFFIAYVGD